MFIAALIIMSKNWKPPKSLSTIECIVVVHSLKGILLSNKNEGTSGSCNKMHELQILHYSEWGKKPASKVFTLLFHLYDI